MNEVRRDIWLPLARERAFALFTERVSDWWPADRRHTGDPHSRLTLEASGPFVERAADGREVPLGRVREWVGGERIVLDWYPGTDALHPTDVEITFVSEGAGTRVSVVHRPTDRSADLWSSRAARYAASWDKVLAAYEMAGTPRTPGLASR